MPNYRRAVEKIQAKSFPTDNLAMKEKLACNISPAWRKVAPTFEDIVSEKQEPIPLVVSLADLAAERKKD